MSMVMEKTADRSRFKGISAEEARIRRDLAACDRLIALYGWDDIVATHVSARLPDEDGKACFLINPFGLTFEEITASSLIKVAMDGEILQDTPYSVNRAGYVVHSAVLGARPDVGCVIHLHSVDGVAVSATERGLLPLNQAAMTIADHVAFHEYEGFATEDEERARIIADLGDKPLMFLRNHGTIAAGSNVGHAFAMCFQFERACTVQVKTLGMGLALHDADPKVIAKTSAMVSTLDRFASEMVWPAMLRKLDRISPGYAD